MQWAVAALLIAVAACWTAAEPAAATPPQDPRTQYLRQIEQGEPDTARPALRQEIAWYREQWGKARDVPGLRGLEYRFGSAGELNVILTSWFEAEARALETGSSKDCESALGVLQDWLPLARRVEAALEVYRAEALAAEPTVDPSDRQRKYAALFAWTRLDHAAGLRRSAAALGRLCASEARAETILRSFRGPARDGRNDGGGPPDSGAKR